MYIRLLFIILCLLFSESVDARMLKIPTDDQIQRYCVPLKLKVDEQDHYFYFKHIIEFNPIRVRIRYGRKPQDVTTIMASEILNYEEAKERLEEIKRSNR